MEPVVVTMIGLSAGAGLGLGWILARFVRVALAATLVALLAAVAVGLILAARAAQGWEGLGFVILALFIALPATIGAAMGTALGRWMRQRAGAR